MKLIDETELASGEDAPMSMAAHPEVRLLHFLLSFLIGRVRRDVRMYKGAESGVWHEQCGGQSQERREPKLSVL